MKTLIILNGELESASFLKKLAEGCDFVICADGGYDKAKSAGVTPDLLIGDFDSVQHTDFAGKIVEFPPEKDYTDCELAIETALQQGADQIVLTCALGGRMDHAMANLYNITARNNVRIREKSVSVYVCNSQMRFCAQNKLFSILPVTDCVLSVTGAKYNLNHTAYPVGKSLGISNVAIESETTVTVHSGKIFLFIHEA